MFPCSEMYRHGRKETCAPVMRSLKNPSSTETPVASLPAPKPAFSKISAHSTAAIRHCHVIWHLGNQSIGALDPCCHNHYRQPSLGFRYPTSSQEKAGIAVSIAGRSNEPSAFMADARLGSFADSSGRGSSAYLRHSTAQKAAR